VIPLPSRVNSAHSFLESRPLIILTSMFVIGGYVPSHLEIDSLVVGVYRGRNLNCSAHVRAGYSASGVRINQAPDDHDVSICEFAGERAGNGTRSV
jgi:hypothetical protein